MINQEKLSNRFNIGEMADQLEIMKAELSIPTLNASDNIQGIMDQLSQPQFVRNLSPSEAAEYSVILAYYAAFLQQESNRYNTFVNWCERNIENIIGKELENSQEYGYVAKSIQIRSKHQQASDLDHRKFIAETKLQTLKMMNQKVQFIAETLKTLAYEKSRIPS